MLIINIDLPDTTWKQACLPIGREGIGISKTADVALLAYIASTYACPDFVSEVLSPSMAYQAKELIVEIAE